MSLDAGVVYIDVKPQLDKFRGDLERGVGDAARSASTKLSDGFKGKLGEIGSTAKAVGSDLTRYVTLPLIGIGTVAVNSALDVNKGLREVNTLFGLAGAEGEKSFLSLKRQTRELSSELGITQTQLTQGLYQALSAGVPRENVFSFLREASKLGIAGLATTEEAVAALSGALNTFKSDGLTANQAADILFNTVKTGKTRLSELAPALGVVGPAAAASGVSFLELNAAMASVTKIIPNTATAAASLRQVFAEADKTGSKFNDQLKTLGAGSLAEADKKFGSFQGTLQAVFKSVGGSELEFKNLFGSVEGAGAALALVGDNADTAATDLKSAGVAAGGVALGFKEIDKGRKLERIKVDLQNALIPLGDVLIPMLEKAGLFVKGLAEKFDGLSPGMKKVVVILGLGLAVLGPLILALGAMAIAVAAISLPVLIVVGVILLLIGIIIVVVKNIDTIKAAFGAVVRFLATFVIEGIRTFVNSFLGIIGLIIAGAATAFGWIPGIGDKLKGASKKFQEFKGDVNNALDGIKDKIINLTIKIERKNFNRTIEQGHPESFIPRQHGGPVTAGAPYLVGEAGPELFIANQSGRIVPNNALGGGSTTVVVNAGVVGHQQDVIAWVLEGLRRAGVRNGGVSFNRG